MRKYTVTLALVVLAAAAFSTPSYVERGYEALRVSNHSLAERYFIKGLSRYNSDSVRAEALHGLAISCFRENKKDVSKNYFEQALQAAENTPNVLAKVYMSYGLFHAAKDPETASGLFNRARLTDPALVPAYHQNMAILAKREKQYDQALDQYQLAYDAYLKAGDTMRTALTLYNIGILHHRSGDIDKSIDVLMETELIAAPYPEVNAKVLDRLFRLLSDRNDPRATAYGRAALEAAATLNENKLSVVETSYRAEQLEQHLANQHERSLWLAGLLLLAAAALTGIGILAWRYRAQRIELRKQSRKDLANIIKRISHLVERTPVNVLERDPEVQELFTGLHKLHTRLNPNHQLQHMAVGEYTASEARDMLKELYTMAMESDSITLLDKNERTNLAHFIMTLRERLPEPS